MARLIVKSPYISGSGVGGYLEYIGTREGVELLPSGYMEYMLERPRSHGLFGDEDCVDMTRVVTHIVDLPPPSQYERAGQSLVTVFTPSKTRRRITSPLKYNKDSPVKP